MFRLHLILLLVSSSLAEDQRVMNHRKLQLAEKQQGGTPNQFIITFQEGVGVDNLLEDLSLSQRT